MTLTYVFLFFVRGGHDRVDRVPGAVQEVDGGVEGEQRGVGCHPGVVDVCLRSGVDRRDCPVDCG